MSRPRVRSERVLALVVSILFLSASGLYYVIQYGKLGDARLATDKTLLMTLAAALLLLAVGLAWVMVRNLARVLAGRRRGVIGSRLQVRVATAFLLLVLVPSLTLFGGAIAIVSGTLESLVTPELEETVEREAELAAAVYRRARVDADHFGRVLAEELRRGPLARGSTAARGPLVRELERARERFDLFAVGYVPRDGSPVSVVASGAPQGETVRPSELSRLPARVTDEVFASGRGTVVDDRLAFGWLTVSVQPVVRGDEVVALVWAGKYLPESLARQLERATRAKADVNAFDRRRPAMQRFYIVLFALLTMLVLFAAVWTGLFLARQITDPILELAQGTRALARGELSYRVPAGADDEIGHLAKSFNKMAEEIERQREALEQRRRYIEILLEAVPVGVVSLDAGGRLTTANREALRALRLESLEAGASVERALAERPLVLELVRPVVAGEAARAEAEVAVGDHGEAGSIEVTAARFPIARNEDGILVVIEDLTRLRRAERLAAWGEVARRVAHEIKNPLTPIRLAAERLRKRYRQDPAAAAQAVEESVATIVREVLSLKSLVDEFSRFARMPEVSPRPGDVGRVVSDAVTLYREGHPGISIRTILGNDLPPHEVDEEAMRRCVINLLDNAVAAIAAREGGGEILVRTSWNARHRAVTLEIEDDGVGLSEADRDRLFLPTFSRRRGGTGLGLAIVHRIVTEHGGQIRAEERAGGGTRIVIELPASVVRGALRARGVET